MNKQTTEMARVYSEELEEVERAYLVDREALLNKQETELNDLLQTRSVRIGFILNLVFAVL